MPLKLTMSTLLKVPNLEAWERVAPVLDSEGYRWSTGANMIDTPSAMREKLQAGTLIYVDLRPLDKTYTQYSRSVYYDLEQVIKYTKYPRITVDEYLLPPLREDQGAPSNTVGTPEAQAARLPAECIIRFLTLEDGQAIAELFHKLGLHIEGNQTSVFPISPGITLKTALCRCNRGASYADYDWYARHGFYGNLPVVWARDILYGGSTGTQVLGEVATGVAELRGSFAWPSEPFIPNSMVDIPRSPYLL